MTVQQKLAAKLAQPTEAVVGVVMGSRSDWQTMSAAISVLQDLALSYEALVVSAHRTPQLLSDYAGSAVSRGLQVIIAGAGGAAHLPGMIAAQTRLPVLGVPVRSRNLNGVDSLLSIVQMPAGVPTATFAIGKSGATNAALFAARLLALQDSQLAARLESWISRQTNQVLENCDLEEGLP